MLADNPLAPQLLTALGGLPLKVDVTVTPSDEVQALRKQVSDLTLQLSDLQAKYNRVEFLYRCETLVNARLVDMCHDKGIKVPPSLYSRPDSAI